MPTPAAVLSSSLHKMQSFSSWLLAGDTSEGDLNSSWREKGRLLAASLDKEAHIMDATNQPIYDVIALSRLWATVSLIVSCIHSSHAAADIVLEVQHSSILWINSYLDMLNESDVAGVELAVFEVLLRAHVLQGCSRQLATLTSAVSASGQEIQGAPPRLRIQEGIKNANLLCDALSSAIGLLLLLADVCELEQPDSPARVPGQQGAPCTMLNCNNSVAQVQTAEAGGRTGTERCVTQRNEVEAAATEVNGEEGNDGLKGHATVSGVGRVASLKKQLVAALYDSCVLEHVARGVLVQAGYLQRLRQAGRQHRPALRELHRRLSATTDDFPELFEGLTDLQDDPELAGADSLTAAGRGGEGTPQPGSDGAPARGHVGEAAHQQHASSHTPLLTAYGHDLPLLHRVLCGPCARHLVLCQGLRALCALDGGGDYGAPEEAGLQGLHLCVEGDEGQPSQPVLINATPLRNLVAVLAMRRGDPGPEAEAQPPGRGTRLQLTLRVALAAGGAKAGAGGSGGGGSGSRLCYVDEEEAASIAVSALRIAWRHMPPPGGRARADRRRAALRRWAAAVEQAARSGVVTGAHSSPVAAHQLGLLLGLHPVAVGPLVPQDLRSLASGGHLLRGSEALVGQVARAVGDQARGNQSNPAGGTQLSTAAGRALSALVTPYGCDVRSCLLRNLLLQPGEDEQPGAGQGQGGEGAGAAGQGGGCSLAAASLAVALGKLLRRCEGAVVEVLGRCSNSGADDDGGGDSTAVDDGDGEGGDTLALEVMCVVCGVLLTCPCCAGSAHQDARAPEEDGGAPGADKVGQAAEQLGCGWEARRRVWVCSYGAWQWLPPLASMVRKAAAAAHVNGTSLLAWQACLDWVRRLCLACWRDGTAGKSGCVGAPNAPAAAAGEGCGAQGGGWREFLLRDVGVVGLLGAALGGVVSELLAGKHEAFGHLLDMIAEACVLAAAAFPNDVAQYAWGAQGGAADGSGGVSSGGSGGGAGSSAVWSPKVLAELATVVGAEQGGQHLAGALRALEGWSGECGSAGRPVGPSAEQKQLLEQAVAAVLCNSTVGACLQQDAALLPPLCELQALLRVCSNPRCMALPPPGQTEAEAEVGGGQERSGAWYCCARCRKQHGRVGRGQARGGAPTPA